MATRTRSKAPEADLESDLVEKLHATEDSSSTTAESMEGTMETTPMVVYPAQATRKRETKRRRQEVDGERGDDLIGEITHLSTTMESMKTEVQAVIHVFLDLLSKDANAAKPDSVYVPPSFLAVKWKKAVPIKCLGCIRKYPWRTSSGYCCPFVMVTIGS
ncbi:PREDICTED: uncharacterized protein LOC106817332 [Priapulus caudatus]|uniref:Uncharacterized protein LOC106817332 n=1 Tax=Priapulus caudatus TaxID=37621 RepID=A0ABM1EZ57_PRICU|nr:PREDICTED: uncharacterized protein LOC106817332 [Priapulus caudatus]